MAELNTIITLRQGKTSEWASSSIVLKSGEMGLEYLEDGSGLVKIKAGDGKHLWGALPYIGSDVKDANVFQVELSEGDTDDIAAIESKVTAEGVEKQNGDVAIVKATISEGKYSYTSYVYDSELDVEGENSSHGWSAMDGNYSATNVFLKNNITLAGDYTSVGNYDKGDTITAGTSLESILSNMLQQELYPNSNDKPNASISVSGGNGEVGSSYTLPTATLTITDVGSYAYGPATGITFAIGDVKLAQGADPGTATNYKTNDAVMQKNSTLKLQATDSETLYTDTAKTYTFSATASYGAGAIPITNLGNEYASAQIPAGDVTIDDKTVTFSGWRYTFAGGTTAATIDSTAIRALPKKKKTNEAIVTAKGDSGIVFTAAKGDTKVIFAYPTSWTTKTPKFELFTMSWGATEGFEKSTVQVADYRGGENGLKEYTVYTLTPATPFAANETKYSVHFE